MDNGVDPHPHFYHTSEIRQVHPQRFVFGFDFWYVGIAEQSKIVAIPEISPQSLPNLTCRSGYQ